MNILIVGAGLAGCTCARLLAESDHQVYVIEKEKTIGGICKDEKDEKHNCYVHTCGPHLFHTDDEWVWNFVKRFADFKEFKHVVKTYFQVHGKPIHKYSDFPVNYNTLSDFFDATIATEKAAKKYMKPLDIKDPKNFEEACLADMGEDVYREFFWWYTQSQWKRQPNELPVSFYKRVPIKFSRDPYLFPDKYQGLPRSGYTSMMAEMLNHKNIELFTETTFEDFKDLEAYDVVIYTGGFKELPYRSTRFFHVEEENAKYPVVNLPGHLAFTRRVNYSLLHPIDETRKPKAPYLVGYELPEKDNSINLILPIPTEENKKKYEQAAIQFIKEHHNAILIGRLATYQYLDMDDVIKQCYSVLLGHHLIK